MATNPRGRLVRVICECCGRAFSARAADRKRGWARACGKSCAARLRERPRPRQVPAPPPRATIHHIGPPGVLRMDGPEFQFVDLPWSIPR